MKVKKVAGSFLGRIKKLTSTKLDPEIYLIIIRIFTVEELLTLEIITSKNSRSMKNRMKEIVIFFTLIST